MCHNHKDVYKRQGNPQTAVYVSSIAKEIVTKYDVDGIHLDYSRYPENASKFPDKDSYHKWADEGLSLIHISKTFISTP